MCRFGEGSIKVILLGGGVIGVEVIMAVEDGSVSAVIMVEMEVSSLLSWWCNRGGRGNDHGS